MDEQQTGGSSETRRTSADYMRFHQPEKKSPLSKLRKPLLVLLTLLLIAAAAYGGYAFLKNRSAEKPKPVAPTTQQQPVAAPPKTSAITTKTKHYDSEVFGLGIDYPADWTVVETPNTNRFVIHSEPTEVTAASGKKQTAQIVLTVNLSGQNLGMFDTGNAVAVIDSKKISYTKPTSSQRGETYLSFLQYPASTLENALDGIYITGDYGYLEGQAIPKIDVAKANPLVTITFLSCVAATCGGALTPLSIDVAMWSNTDFAKPLETMLRSITIQ